MTTQGFTHPNLRGQLGQDYSERMLERVLDLASQQLRHVEEPTYVTSGGVVKDKTRKRREIERAELDTYLEVLDFAFGYGELLEAGNTQHAIEEALRRRVWPDAPNPWRPRDR